MHDFLKKNLVAKRSCKKSILTIKGNTSVNQMRVWMSASHVQSAT